jgi:hypothetical protein
MIKVTWYMKKYKKVDSRQGILDDKSKEWTDKNGNRCLTFWDTVRNRYTTAVNYKTEEVA